MLIRGPIINGNALNSPIAKKLRAGANASRPTEPNATVPNTPLPADAQVMISKDAVMRFREGLPTK